MGLPFAYRRSRWPDSRPPRVSPWVMRWDINVGDTGCQRIVSPFSWSRMRQCSGSRSSGVKVRAPPRRQAVSVCSRSSSVSSPGHLLWFRRPAIVLRAACPAVPGGCCAACAAWARVLPDSGPRSGCRRRPRAGNAPQRGDEMLGGSASAAGVAAGHHISADKLIINTAMTIKVGPTALIRSSSTEASASPGPGRSMPTFNSSGPGDSGAPNRQLVWIAARCLGICHPRAERGRARSVAWLALVWTTRTLPPF